MATTIALEHTTVIINGHTVTGWADEADALSTESRTIAEIHKGAVPGDHFFTRTGDAGAPLMLKLLPFSPSVQFLGALVARDRKGEVIRIEGSISNTQTGVSVTLQSGVITESDPFQTQGSNAAANREFKMEFGLVSENLDAARFSVRA